MTTRPPVWVVELARRFWVGVPEPPPPFPRDFVAVLAWMPHIRIVELPGLSVSQAATFLARAGAPFRSAIPDRPLRGCLAAFAGHGYILVDADDDLAERRFTVPHELAHFLRDYEEPRRRAVARLGPQVLEVFDGLRAPTAGERLAGILRGVTVGCHTHLLDRNDAGRVESQAIRESEDAADRLAFELLAPFDALNTSPAPDPVSLTDRLVSGFGFPPRAAARYATRLFPDHFSQKVHLPLAKN